MEILWPKYRLWLYQIKYNLFNILPESKFDLERLQNKNTEKCIGIQISLQK